MAKAIEVTLGGRKLRQVLKSTVRHDLWFMEKIRRSGLKEITINAGEDARDFAERLLNSLIQSGSVTPLVAGCFVDEDMEDLKWSPAFAQQLETFLNELSEQDDKNKLFEIVVNLVMGFFETGVVSLMTSLNSLKKDQTRPQKSEDSSPIAAAGTPSMESLMKQSGGSPGMTTISSKLS